MQEAFAIGFANIVGAFFRNGFLRTSRSSHLAPKKGLNGKAFLIPLSAMYIMRRRPSTFFIHVRISSAKQIFTLDLIFVAHNSCGQS